MSDNKDIIANTAMTSTVATYKSESASATDSSQRPTANPVQSTLGDFLRKSQSALPTHSTEYEAGQQETWTP
ncbi:hypothetical protein IAT38_004710 [Cryptococcus sp. DSM 104549]